MVVMDVCYSDKCSTRQQFEFSSENLHLLKEILPSGFQHVICRFKEGAEGQFDVTCRANLFTQNDAEKWMECFQEASKTTLRIRRKLRPLCFRVLYKVEYRCQHNTLPRTSSANNRRGSKNTDCPATLAITVHKTKMKQKSRSADPHLLEFPGVINIKYCHNHPVHSASALKHRDVSEHTRARLEELILQGYAPGAALELLKYDLQIEHGDNYVYVSGDRAICPDRDYVYRLYYKLGKEKYGESGGMLQVPHLKVFVETLEEKFQEKYKGSDNKINMSSSFSSSSQQMHADTRQQEIPLLEREDLCELNRKYICMDVTDSNEVIVAICTPLMHRVHHYVKHSNEMVFVDSTGNMDRNHCRVFVLLTHTCVGGLPLGVLITTSESQKCIKEAMRLLCNMIGPVGFGGRGILGPVIFMTDDSSAERGALQELFPASSLLLCNFHVLQAFWRYLWDGKNGVKKNERPLIFSLVRLMMFAPTEEELTANFLEAMANETLRSYPKITSYVEKLFERKKLWATCFRSDMLIRGNNTNNFSEAAMQVLKEQILNRTKAFNVQQLVDFIVNKMESYYERRCIDISNNVLCRVRQSRYLRQDIIDLEAVHQVGENQFEVISTRDPSNRYRVDMTMGICTCKEGCTGGPCKHQAGVVRKFGLQSWNFIPEADPKMRQLLCLVGTGKLYKLSWFQSLKVNPFSTHVVSITQDCQFVSESTVGPSDCPDHLQQKQSGQTEETISSNLDQQSGQLVLQMKECMQKLTDHLEAKLLDQPDTFQEAVKKFLKNTERITTDSHLISALHTFGKYSGVSLPTGRNRVVSNKKIGVQPTSLQRRLKAVPGVRRQGIGRPTKASTPVHNRVPLSVASLPKRKRSTCSPSGSAASFKRRKAAHNLSECVLNNTSLGKTHSQK